MQIILNQDAANWIYKHFREWEKLGVQKFDFPDWKRSPLARENRRESIVYSNCAEYLCWLLRNAVDENGESWWVKLSVSNSIQPAPASEQPERPQNKSHPK